MKTDEILGILEKHNGDRGGLISMLEEIQTRYNYLPIEALQLVADETGRSLVDVYSVATFYKSFSLTERGKHLIKVCDGTACHLRGAKNIRDEISRDLGVEEGQATLDKKFSFEVVACLGACALAPVMAVDEKCHGKMNPEKIRAALGLHKKRKKEKN